MKSFLKSLFTKNNQVVGEVLSFINNNSLMLAKADFTVQTKSKLPAKYSFTEKKVNIPLNFRKTNINKNAIQGKKQYLGVQSANFVIAHELGHAVHHQSFLYNKRNYINILENSALNKLITPNLEMCDYVDAFIHSNFAESYADCYAGLVLYLKDGDINVLSNIFNYRKEKYESFKNAQLRFNYQSNGNCEVYQGKFAINRYYAYDSVAFFKKNVLDCISKEKLLKMPYSDLHNLIQVEVMNGVYNALVREVNTNDLFYNDFMIFVESKELSIEKYFIEMDKHINSFRLMSMAKSLNKILSKKINIDDLIQWQKDVKKGLLFNKFSLLDGSLDKEIINYIKSNFKNTLLVLSIKEKIQNKHQIIEQCKGIFLGQDLYRFKKLHINSISSNYLLIKE